MSENGNYISREAAREAVWQILNGMGYSEKHNDRLVEEVDAVFDDIPAAEDILIDAFGYAPGLAAADPDVKRRKANGNKAKPNRLYVRLDNELMERVKSTAARLHFAFMQDMIEAALLQFVGGSCEEKETRVTKGRNEKRVLSGAF